MKTLPISCRESATVGLLIFLIFLVLHGPQAAPGKDMGVERDVRIPSAAKLERFEERRANGGGAKGGSTVAAQAKDTDGGGARYIIGGQAADPGEWPFTVALVDSAVGSNFAGHFCGGALVHPYWVVTAAHCVFDKDPSEVDVVLGVDNLAVTTGTQRIAVEEIVIHPDYNDFTLDSDLAMLRLALPADPIHPTVPIIDDMTLADPGIVTTTLGWGATNPDGSGSPFDLQEVMMPIVTLAVANAPAAHDGDLTANMLPVGFAGGGFSSCFGDSGGPVVVPSPVGDGWALAGIVSFGKADTDCAAPNNYSIYTRVYNFRDFILECIQPIYLRWEVANSVIGRLRNPDGDAYDNFADFSFLDDPNVFSAGTFLTAWYTSGGPDTFPTATFIRPINSAGTEYCLLYSTDFTNYVEYPFEANILSQVPVPGDPEAEEVTVMVPEAIEDNTARVGFITVGAKPSSNVVLDLKNIEYPFFAKRQLTDEDEGYPGQATRRQKRFRIMNPPVGTPIAVGLRSGEFNPVLEIINNDTGATIMSSSSNNAGGQDEELRFTPSGGIDYVVRATTQSAGEVGDFHVAIYRQDVEVDEVNVAFPDPIPSLFDSTLNGADPFDPNFPTEQYYAEDYLLLPDSSLRPVRVQVWPMANAFDSDVSIINAENGNIVARTDSGIPGFNTDISFVAQDRTPYIIRASSTVELLGGFYTMQVHNPPGIAVGANLVGMLEMTDSVYPNGPFGDSYYDDYFLEGASPGQSLRANMISTLDGYMYILDAETEEILFFDDDSGGSLDPLINFTVQPGVTYVIRCSSYFSRAVGGYSLFVTLN